MSENVFNKNSSIHLIPPPNFVLLFNQFNNTSREQNVDAENIANSRYLDIDEIHALKLRDKSLCFVTSELYFILKCYIFSMLSKHFFNLSGKYESGQLL